MSLPHPCSEDSLPQDRGDGLRAAFDADLAAHRAELLAYMHKRMGDPDTAADLTQETLSRMMRYRDAPHIEDRRLMLFRIAHNLILEHHRAEGRHHAALHVPLDEAGPLPRDESPVETITAARVAIDQLLKHTIAQLPPKCRLAFMLNRFDGLTYPQVASRMGISVKMVEKHMTRALLACRAAVGDQDA